MEKVMSINELIEKFGGMVYRLGYMYTSDKQVAEDIRQEVFIAAYKHLANIESPKSWLTRSTINKARSYWRSKQRRPETVYHDEETIPDYSQDTLYEESDVLEAIRQLPLKYKEVILLYYYQGFSTNEIASYLNVPDSTVRVRMSRARALLQHYLEGVNEQ